MSFAGISTKQVWVKKDTDCSTCTGCHTMIMSAKYVLCVEVKAGTKSETLETGTILCESCYEAIKPQNKNA